MPDTRPKDRLTIALIFLCAVLIGLSFYLALSRWAEHRRLPQTVWTFESPNGPRRVTVTDEPGIPVTLIYSLEKGDEGPQAGTQYVWVGDSALPQEPTVTWSDNSVRVEHDRRTLICDFDEHSQQWRAEKHTAVSTRPATQPD